MARKKSNNNDAVAYQLKVSLLHSPLPIWRRLVVRADVPLDMVHEIIQVAMGWSNCHPHQFEHAGKRYGDSEEAEDDKGLLDYTQYTISDLMKEPGDEVIYRYDFGDDWEHKIVLEKISIHSQEEANFLGFCLGGKRACPPEDVGGPPGYADFLEAIEDPEHEEYMDRLQWIGCDFDPDSFDARLVNLRISMFEEGLASLGEILKEEFASSM